MKYVVPRGDANFEPKDPLWEEKVRESFERQGAMHLLGATISDVWPGGCDIRLPFRQDLTQQHGFFHAGITATLHAQPCLYA